MLLQGCYEPKQVDSQNAHNVMVLLRLNECKISADNAKMISDCANHR